MPVLRIQKTSSLTTWPANQKMRSTERTQMVANPSAMLEHLKPLEISTLLRKPGLTRAFFGTALDRKIKSIYKDTDILAAISPRFGNSPMDFVNGSHGFEITGGSLSSLFSHSKRVGVNAVITYESIPSNYFKKLVDSR